MQDVVRECADIISSCSVCVCVCACYCKHLIIQSVIHVNTPHATYGGILFTRIAFFALSLHHILHCICTTK